MSRWHSYLHSAQEILSLYGGEEPFPNFIKKYFAAHKKFGSSDRKQVSHLCYCYFRLGKALPGIPVDERILTALFLCSTAPDRLLQELRPDWNDKTVFSSKEKIAFTGEEQLAETIFPWKDELSDGIDAEAFALSHLVQPDLFLRLRSGKENSVKKKLDDAGISCELAGHHSLALPNGSKIDGLIELDKEAVVQDLSSQQVGDLLTGIHFNAIPEVWDCCAASGGKSIMVTDLLKRIDLTVSDARESILVNLAKRFSRAGIGSYKSFVADLTKPLASFTNDIDLLIADAPCSGSGTWGRNPEQLFYFDEEKISAYAALQQQILSNTIPHLRPGGYLLYITCSVFKKENEDNVSFIKEKFRLHKLRPELIKGYDRKADSMFACLMQRPL